MMKSKLFTLAALGAMSIGTANAVPMVWTDIYNPPDVTLYEGGNHDYTHDIRDGAGGYRPGVDSVDYASLRIWLADDQTGWNGDSAEYVEFRFDGNWSNSYEVGDEETFEFNSSVWNWLIDAYLNPNWLNDGLLNVRVHSDDNDFKFKKSELTVYGNQVAVPEPATLALLSLGLLGVGFTARRRKA